MTTQGPADEPQDQSEPTGFEGLNLPPELLKAVEAMGFSRPTPIQRRSVPVSLTGADVLGSAQTGSGKTVAFSLPMLCRLLCDRERRRGVPRALVLVPTRELASQVEETVSALSRFSPVRCALVIGGASWNTQVSELKAGAEVVVATPGRLLDHVRNNKGFRLDHCQFLVLDEADRMLDMGFLPDIRAILERLPKDRQTLMFSATIPPEIERLVGQFMRSPERVQIDPPRQAASGISQRVYPVSAKQKYELLLALLRRKEVTSALVFTGTKRNADIVGGYLVSHKLAAAVLHSDLSQARRDQALDSFREQKCSVLVATDIAARGIDVRHVSHVFNFDVPLYAEDYLHRIGRTARAFTVGEALTLMTPPDKPHLESIERSLSIEIQRCALDGFPYDVPPKLEAFKPSIQSRFRRLRRSTRSGGRGFL